MIRQALLLVLTPLLATSSIRAGDFDNWYFKFFSAPTEARGKFFNPAGKQVETVTGSMTGEVSKDGREFVQKARFEYKEMGTKADSTLRWKKGADGKFEGTYEDSNGTKVSYTLTLKDGGLFRTESTGPNGVTIESNGRLDKDGNVYSEDKMRTAERELMIRIESVIIRE